MTDDTGLEPAADFGHSSRPPEDETAGLHVIGDLIAPWTPAAAAEQSAAAATGFDPPGVWAGAARHEQRRVERTGRRATVFVAELQGMIWLATRVGQDAADGIVSAIAELVSRHLRGSDRMVQVGPYRFDVLLPETDEGGATALATRVQAACDEWMTSGRLAVRLAIGVAELRPGGEFDAAILEAEERLRTGRRTTREAQPSDPAPPDAAEPEAS